MERLPLLFQQEEKPAIQTTLQELQAQWFLHRQDRSAEIQAWLASSSCVITSLEELSKAWEWAMILFAELVEPFAHNHPPETQYKHWVANALTLSSTAEELVKHTSVEHPIWKLICNELAPYSPFFFELEMFAQQELLPAFVQFVHQEAFPELIEIDQFPRDWQQPLYGSILEQLIQQQDGPRILQWIQQHTSPLFDTVTSGVLHKEISTTKLSQGIIDILNRLPETIIQSLSHSFAQCVQQLAPELQTYYKQQQQSNIRVFDDHHKQSEFFYF